jgi:TonB family protein
VSDPGLVDLLVVFKQMRSSLLLVVVLAGTMLYGQSDGDEKPYRIGGSVSAPQLVYKVEPEYTQKGLAARRQGSALLQLVVTRDGMPSDIHDIGGQLGFGLDEKAIEAVQQWRFRPGRKGNHPVSVIVTAEVVFRLPH